MRTTELQDQLQEALAGTYVRERELGGGGMSRVFVAEETALGRLVVLKVLPPEMCAACSTDRFRREIQLAASLLHPHIIPLLSAGETRGILYCVLADLRQREETEFIWPMGLAMAYAYLGEESTALDYLERAYEERVGWMLMISREPALDVLRPSPRFQSLLQKIGPPQALTDVKHPVRHASP